MKRQNILMETGLKPIKLVGKVIHLTRHKTAPHVSALCGAESKRFAFMPLNTKVTCERCLKSLLHVVAKMSCCPECSYPKPDFKGIYTPGQPCPQCRYNSATGRVESIESVGKDAQWRTPSRAAHEAAVALLKPPPEFQMMMHLLKQNTIMLEQTAKILEMLTKAILDNRNRAR